MRYVDVDGAEIAYRIDGRGPALVLLHGTGGDSESNWAPIAERLSASRTVIRPDLPGAGATRDAGGPLTVAGLSDMVASVAADADAADFDLVGFSMGAGIAVHLAATRPDRVRSLMPSAVFASSRDARLRMQFELWRDLIRGDRETLARLILLTGFSPAVVSGMGEDGVTEAVEQILGTADWDGMLRHVELDLRLDVRPVIDRVRSRTLVVGCHHDHMVPASHARDMAERIADARYAELSTGHLAPMEAPETVAALIADFLDG